MKTKNNNKKRGGFTHFKRAWSCRRKRAQLNREFNETSYQDYEQKCKDLGWWHTFHEKEHKSPKLPYHHVSPSKEAVAFNQKSWEEEYKRLDCYNLWSTDPNGSDYKRLKCEEKEKLGLWNKKGESAKLKIYDAYKNLIDPKGVENLFGQNCDSIENEQRRERCKQMANRGGTLRKKKKY